jgi:hypothetical protein
VEIIKDLTLDVLLAGCPPTSDQPTLAIQRLAPSGSIAYSWKAALTVVGTPSSISDAQLASSPMPGPISQDQAVQQLLQALARQQAPQGQARGAGPATLASTDSGRSLRLLPPAGAGAVGADGGDGEMQRLLISLADEQAVALAPQSAQQLGAGQHQAQRAQLRMPGPRRRAVRSYPSQFAATERETGSSSSGSSSSNGSGGDGAARSTIHGAGGSGYRRGLKVAVQPVNLTMQQQIPLYHAQAGAAWSGLHAPRVLLQDAAQDEAGPSNALPFPLGRAKAVAVQAKFTRDVVSQEWRLGGAIQISSPKPTPTQAGWPSVLLIFASGASARVPADCPPSATAPGGRGLLLPAAPGKVTCSWQLAKPQPGPLEGQAVAMLEGASPAAMSQITPFTSDGAKPDTLGACAAVSALWALEGLPGGGGGGSSGAGGASGSGSADALLKVATSGGAPPAQGAEVCESKVYSWTLQLGPFKEAQCAAAAAGVLKLAGSAAAQPLTGRTPKAAAAATARVALTGCPTAKVAG